jgi:hypothetical protein
MVHWMRNRQPRFKGGYQGEMERPSPSYVIDVSSPETKQNICPILTYYRCSHLWQGYTVLLTRFLLDISIPLSIKTNTPSTSSDGHQKAEGYSQAPAVANLLYGMELVLTSRLSCKHMM